MTTNKKNKTVSAIAATAWIVNEVVVSKKSLPDCIADCQQQINPDDTAKVQAYCYNILRRYEFYRFIVNALLDKKLKNKDQDIYHLIISGVMLLNEARLPAHAAISETVNVTRKSKKSWSKNLVNALLRRYQREQQQLHALAEKDLESQYCCPQWLLEKIQQAYPAEIKSNSDRQYQWQSVLKANMAHPPLTLRVNQLSHSREQYLGLLKQAGIEASACPLTQNGILLEQAVAVNQLPLFADGAVSVQDSAAQLSAELLKPQAGERILDACAAPGGKTMHLLESCPEVEKLVALDVSARRLERVTQNLERLAPQLKNKLALLAADAADINGWWDKQPFDKILLDAPCSATGVIRRHPDIKRLRQPADIVTLLKTQKLLLEKLWQTLKPGGLLLYATCSILPEENSEQIRQFLSTHNDAQSVNFNVSLEKSSEYGLQLLPHIMTVATANKGNSDGFYYCLLQKK